MESVLCANVNWTRFNQVTFKQNLPVIKAIQHKHIGEHWNVQRDATRDGFQALERVGQ